MALIVKGSVNNEPPKQPEIKKEPVAQQPAPTNMISSLQSIKRPTIQEPTIKRSPVQQNQEPSNAIKYVRSEPRRQISRDEHYLVVDGKEKKIGKQSRYLVDMLTIEE